MSYSAKTSPDVPTESGFHLLPTTRSSGSAHNLQFPLRQISPPLNPAPHPVARLPAQSSLSPPSPRNRSPSSPRPRLPNPPLHPRSRCLLPAQSASLHNSRAGSH